MSELTDKEKLKDFFQHEKLISLKSEAGTTAAWDWNTALGETVREKYESLYIKVVELTNVTIRKGASGLFWIVVSPVIASIFETVCTTIPSANDWLEQIPMGGKDVYYLGTVNRKWRIYVDPEWADDEMMVGANWEPKTDPKHVGVLKTCNLII